MAYAAYLLIHTHTAKINVRNILDFLLDMFEIEIDILQVQTSYQPTNQPTK